MNKNVYVHRATGRRFIKLDEVTDCSYAGRQQKMVLYKEEGEEGENLIVKDGMEFAREFIAEDLWNETHSKFIRLCEACSDVLYGGEGGWQNVKFEKFIDDCRKSIAYANRAKNAAKECTDRINIKKGN
jgi:hypothetical protein